MTPSHGTYNCYDQGCRCIACVRASQQRVAQVTAGKAAEKKRAGG
jgi:hypothetical protein